MVELFPPPPGYYPSKVIDLHRPVDGICQVFTHADGATRNGESLQTCMHPQEGVKLPWKAYEASVPPNSLPPTFHASEGFNFPNLFSIGSKSRMEVAIMLANRRVLQNMTSRQSNLGKKGLCQMAKRMVTGGLEPPTNAFLILPNQY